MFVVCDLSRTHKAQTYSPAAALYICFIVMTNLLLKTDPVFCKFFGYNLKVSHLQDVCN
jgi:hypothetical protein